MKVIKRTFLILSLGLVLTAAVNSVNAKPLKDSKNLFRKQIVGAWQIKQNPANGKFEKIKNNKNGNLAAVVSAPTSIVLVADDEFGEVTINEGFEKVLHTQTLSINKTEGGAKAFWKNKKLIVEKVSADGIKMTEIFELGTNKNQLKVTLRFEDAKTAKTVIKKHIYNRTAEQIDGGQTAASSVNVSDYLL